MNAFVLDYGLFLAKFLTIFILIGLLIGTLLVLVAKKRMEKETLMIKKINTKFDNMKEMMETEVLSKEQLKALTKEKKKEEKEKKKLQKKSSTAENQRPRIFVIKFQGDIQASAVSQLRECVSAVLCIATPKDEVMILLESSGGLVHHYGLAASQLQRIRDKHITLTITVDLVAASGGYLMACIANKIIAAPFAILGSIGVLAELPNFHRFLDKHAIDIEHHTAGEHKTTLTLFGENTEKSRAKFKEELQETHQLFKNFVHNYRPQLDIQKTATGEHWYAVKALSLKLVDEIMTSDQYLLEKSKTTDIFEISYLIHKNIKEKITSLVQAGFQSAKKLLFQQFS